MKLTKEEVEHVAKLSRLAVSEAEKETFSRQLSDILTYIKKLDQLNTHSASRMGILTQP